MSITIAKHVIFIINQHGCNIDNVILRSTNWKRTPFLFGFRAGNMRRRPPNNGQQSSLSCLPGLAVMAAMAAMAASAPLSLPPCHHFFSNSPSLSLSLQTTRMDFSRGGRVMRVIARSVADSVININVRHPP